LSALCRWFKSRAHAAELTAGYYNTRERNGYLPIFEMLQRHGAAASFTCVEMRDCEHPLEGRCSPEGLLNQVRCAAGLGGGERNLWDWPAWCGGCALAHLLCGSNCMHATCQQVWCSSQFNWLRAAGRFACRFSALRRVWVYP
jgi:hypothetical protein